MAVLCARCGSQNPDGNRFCTSCGTPLVPVAAQVPAVPVGAVAGSPFAAPPYAAPPAFAPQPEPQGTYYAPQPGLAQPAVHRVPWVLVISVVVALVLVLGGLGTVLAFALGSKHGVQGSAFAALSSPSPATTPSPGSQPSVPAGQTVSNSSLSLVVPRGWQVINKDDSSITIQSPDGDGTLTVASGQSSPPQSTQQLKDSIDRALAQHYPDAATCPNTPSNSGAIGGVGGVFWIVCFTATSSGQSVPVAEPLWVGANASGSIAYVVVLQTMKDNTDAFVKKCAPILQGGITWSLK